ncbi:hypothetical protein QBC44DRAFT_399022 [Cladorrhinum sp. PSN332]|nr:hypothetical protein QBC44DRAFT_399022 [Cladorrhinum sp. PSN332]
MELVVGIDFGTTYSGVSYALQKKGSGKIGRVSLIQKWHDPNSVHSNTDIEKVPTRMLINRHNDSVDAWGYSAQGASTNTELHTWFKLRLQPNFVPKDGNLSRKFQGYLSPVVSTTKFLQQMWSHVQPRLPPRGTYQSSRTVLTVPAAWSFGTKQMLRKAAEEAGISGRIDMVSEPEAAALAVFQDRTEAGSLLEVGDIFTVCDAGGGTVDLITYRVVSTVPLEVEEIVEGIAGTCGSTLVDNQFKKFLDEKFGNGPSRVSDEEMEKMMHHFEQNTKRSFDGRDRDVRVPLFTIDHEGKTAVSGEITISGQKMRDLFDVACNEVIALVKDQMDKVEGKGFERIKAVLLVGGFGESKYLQRAIQSALGESTIEVILATKSWSAVCRGATIWGAQESVSRWTVTGRIARCSYGIIQTEPVPKDQRTNKMLWLIKKGDQVESGKAHTGTITETADVKRRHRFSLSRQTFTHTLWSCGDNVPPEKFPHEVVESFCRVSCALRKRTLFINNPEDKTVDFELAVTMGSASLDFSVKFQDGEVAHCEAEYVN